ncbi:pannexin-1-like [Crotalus tigris]|uniref:pannexin-1-like n=1 Tax=Crotalus tigris TaxID=88082 RepID=UPI00192F1AF4|nr:pannexin-1-like [Crotalus tigris]
MAIAHIATEYVFSDFLLKEPSESRYKGLRLELALDKLVTCIAVGLPLLLISLAFAQEISIGSPHLTTVHLVAVQSYNGTEKK